MADFALPNLGENINEADVLKVLVAEGDVIKVDQPLLEIETEKATLDVPSEVAGRVTKIHIAPGDVVKPGQVLMTVESGVAAEAAPAAPAVAAAPAPAEAAPAATAPAPEAAAPAATSTPAPAAPAAPAPAPAPAAAPAPTAGRQPATSEEDTTTAEPSDVPVFASPSTRRFAREVGLDLRGIVGSGPGGRISDEDVKRHVREQTSRPVIVNMAPEGAPAAERVVLPDFAQWGEVTREPLTRLRRTVVRNMAQSWSEIPHVHLYHHADITAMEALRQQWKDRAKVAGGNLTISVMLLKIVAAALKAHPRINASLNTETNELILKKYVHLGVAVDTERGLVVPKIENVDQKNIIELSVELNEIAGRARENKLTIDEQRGASFTVTNLGSLGTGYFDPIINWPEIAILGLGRAETVPVWENGEWKPQLRMPMSFGMDHRIIDGADGARFMAWIVDTIKNPMIMVLGG